MQIEYSPFENKIDDLTTSDLASLKQVHEGWYVEYKSKMVKPSDIAKAVSAFANTYGGWLFIGITEDSKGKNVAGEYPGVPIKEKDQIRSQFRSALATNVNPTPYYELLFVDGPDDTIGLDEGKSVLVIKVPRSVQAPHVHKDGRIYKRVSDSSEPKPESDPHLLSQLWRRREKADEMIGRWLGENPEFSDAESKGPYLRVLLTPDDWGQSNVVLNAKTNEVRAVLAGSPDDGHHMPLETIHRTSSGYIGRQTGGNDCFNYGVTFQADHFLNCEFVIPVRWHEKPPDELSHYLYEYKYAEEFTKIVKKGYHNTIKVMDLNYLYPAIIAMVTKYRNLMRLAGKETPYFGKIVLLNGWRLTPFLDDQDFIDQVKEYGVPMVMKEEVISPSGRTAGSFLEVIDPGYEEDYSEKMKCNIQAFIIAIGVFELMGIDVVFDDRHGEKKTSININNLFNASERAKKNFSILQKIYDLSGER